MAVDQALRDPIGAAEQLRTVVAAFGRFIAELPDTAVVEKACGPKEVLADLVFWMESFVLQTDALLANQPPQPPQGSFDDLNAQAVEASRGVAHRLADGHTRAATYSGEVLRSINGGDP